MQEESSYPQSSFIKLFDKHRTFHYEIVREGTYPSPDQCYYTKKPSRHPIPHNYIVKTWHGKGKYLAKCSIRYRNRKPLYTVHFGPNLALQVESSKSVTDAACQYYQVNFISSTIIISLFMINTYKSRN